MCGGIEQKKSKISLQEKKGRENNFHKTNATVVDGCILNHTLCFGVGFP
jgi:hypothetical protein